MLPRTFFNLGPVSEMPFPTFSAGIFQQINTKENAAVSCEKFISHPNLMQTMFSGK